MQFAIIITRRRSLNDRANFHADIKAIVKRADQHQNPGAGQIQLAWGI
jgi:predicted GNAT family acetyltransferase